jgi:aerobic carbon-monoxide dehydrogenase small subunit
MRVTDQVRLYVNGVEHDAPGGSARQLGAWLREDLGLTGTKLSCEQGFCGACSVLVDGELTSACSVLVADVDGAEVVTVEGLATGDELHPVQQAFLDERGFQCGFCTPGMVVAAVALLSEKPSPSDVEIRSHFEGNLCRCTGYAAIQAAVRRAAIALESPGTPRMVDP